LQEFGLNLLFFLLKQDHLSGKNAAHCARINPLFPILLDYMDSPHATVISVTLRCWCWVVKMPLECITDSNMMDLTNKVLILLKRYGGGTDCKGENADLVTVASKLLAVLIRDIQLTQIKDDQLKTVFEYILIDVMDPIKQSTAFSLLNAVLIRRIIHEDLHNLMMKLAELIIFKAETTKIAQQVRSSLMSYMTKYEIKEKLGDILDFFVAQLKFQEEFGRLSAAQTLGLIFSSLGNAVDSHAEFLFVSMAPHLSNTDSENTRNAIAKTMGSLLSAVSPAVVSVQLDSTITWFQSEDSLPKVVLACRLLAIFVETLGMKVIKPKLKMIMAKLNTLFQSNDNALIQVLKLIIRMARNDPGNTVFINRTTMDGVKSCLMHGHTGIRLLSTQLLGLNLAQVASEPEGKIETWIHNEDTLRSLILDSFEQLKQVDHVTSEMSLQVVKNLVAMTKLIKPPNENEVVRLSLEFVLKRSIKISNHELVHNSREVVKRTLVFNYIAAVVMHSEKHLIQDVLSLILTPLQREISSNSSDPGLQKHAQEVVQLIKTKFVDDEEFMKVLVEVQVSLQTKRTERTENLKQRMISDPEIAAKRKLGKTKRKVASKKKKMSTDEF